MVIVRKVLILIHRYLGTALCLLFLMWFLTGIGMIYSRGMPRLTNQARLARMPALDMDRIHITPSQALDRAELGFSPERAQMLTVMDRPAYRFNAGGPVTVFADDGEVLAEIGPEQAATVASRFLNVTEDKVRYLGMITEPDQWTQNQGRSLPLHKFAIDDATHAEVYVSPVSAEIAVLTTRASRALAWVSTIPHWMYFAALRSSGRWLDVITWAAGIGCILAIVGIVLGVVQFRYRRPVKLPYSGLTRLHYALGLFFGVLTLTWVFSGMLSLEPFEWTLHDDVEIEIEDAFATGELDFSQYSAMDAAAWRQVFGDTPIKEVQFTRIEGQPHYIVRTASGDAPLMGPPDGGHQPYFVARSTDSGRLVVSANPLAIRTEPVSSESITNRLKTALPETPIVESQMLAEYDSYYYSRDGEVPLPVLRVKLDDPAKTWVYIDPEVNEVVAQVQRNNRIERWLYNSLHTLDFSFLYYRRPLWDAVVIILSLGGAALSGLGVIMGFKRGWRAIKRKVKSSRTAADEPAPVH